MLIKSIALFFSFFYFLHAIITTTTLVCGVWQRVFMKMEQLKWKNIKGKKCVCN